MTAALTLSPAVLLALLALLLLARPGAPARRFASQLSGAEEVPPVATRASGQARFRLNREENVLDFRLFARDIQGVTEAHIHLGARGTNGPIVAFLFGPVREGVSPRGLLSAGSITAGSLVGPLQGAGLERLVAEMRQGNTYVNVHTLAHPDGEIRGQIALRP